MPFVIIIVVGAARQQRVVLNFFSLRKLQRLIFLRCDIFRDDRCICHLLHSSFHVPPKRPRCLLESVFFVLRNNRRCEVEMSKFMSTLRILRSTDQTSRFTGTFFFLKTELYIGWSLRSTGKLERTKAVSKCDVLRTHTRSLQCVLLRFGGFLRSLFSCCDRIWKFFVVFFYQSLMQNFVHVIWRCAVIPQSHKFQADDPR